MSAPLEKPVKPFELPAPVFAEQWREVPSVRPEPDPPRMTREEAEELLNEHEAACMNADASKCDHGHEVILRALTAPDPRVAELQAENERLKRELEADKNKCQACPSNTWRD